MRYQECLQLTAVYLNDDKLLAYTKGTAMADEGLVKQLEVLSACTDLVINEIACEYYPLKKKETLSAQNGKIDFARLSQSLVDVYAVRRNGERVPYRLLSDGIETQGTVEIEYSYAPAFSHPVLESELPYLGGKITSRVLALGIAAEYCMITDRADEAVTFDGMFKEAILSARSDKGNLRIKKRKWE